MKEKRQSLNMVFRLTAIAAASITICLAGCGSSPEEKRLRRIRSGDEGLNVILVSVDTLRADALGCYGGEIVPTPNIDKLAAGGTLFEGCKTPVPITLPAHTTMLTGTSPAYHNVHTNPGTVPDEELVFLSEVLRERGYRTAGFVGGLPLSSHTEFDQGFDDYDDRFLDGYESPANAVWGRARYWLDDKAGERFFLFMHFYDPHQLYTPPERYLRGYKDRPYFGEVAFVDDVMGGFLRFAEKKGLLNDTLIIFTSDHGESLGEHGELTHGFFVYEATQHVPLIFYSPGLIPAGRRVEGTVQLMDIYPTVLDILGVEVPPQSQGKSLVRYIYESKKAESEVVEEAYSANNLFGWAKVNAIEKDGWKYVDLPKPELYNLANDGAETKNLVDEAPEIARALAERLDESTGELAVGGLGAAPNAEIPEDDIDKLRSLGYAGYDRGNTAGAGIDPKDKTEYIRLYAEFRELHRTTEASGKRELAIIAERMAAMEPDQPYPFLALGNMYLTAGKPGFAEKYYAHVAETHPDMFAALIGLVGAYRLMGRLGDAKKTLAKMENDAGLSPNELSKVYYEQGVIALAESDSPLDAAGYLEKAVSLDEKYENAYLLLAEIYGKSPRGSEKAKEYAARFLELEPRGERARRMRAILGQEPVETFYTKGKRAYLEQDFDEAAGYFRRAYEVDPTYYEARYNLVCCLALAGRPDEAIAELERLVRDQPGVFDEAIATDPDLDSLRSRDDFGDLLN
jgi:choline-sulfatase